MQAGWRGHTLGGFLWWCRVLQHVLLSLAALGLGMLLRDALVRSSSQQVGQVGSLQQLWCAKPRGLTGKGDSSLCWSETLGCPKAGTQHPHTGCLPELSHSQ